MTPTPIPTIVRAMAAQPGGISWPDLVNLFGEHAASDAVNLLLTACVVEGHRIDDGPWIYSVPRRVLEVVA